MHKHTKIVATISDKRCEVPFLKELYEAGMNVVRLNSAHLDEKGFMSIINNVREVSDEIAILVDTKGPEIRTTFAEGDIGLKTGEEIKIVGNPEGISSREIINQIHETGFSFDGIILNAGGYTHTSVAIRDAIKAVKTPVVEVHISNVYGREEFRHKSMLTAVCVGVIAGFGLNSYKLAIESLLFANK